MVRVFRSYNSGLRAQPALDGNQHACGRIFISAFNATQTQTDNNFCFYPCWPLVLIFAFLPETVTTQAQSGKGIRQPTDTKLKEKWTGVPHAGPHLIDHCCHSVLSLNSPPRCAWVKRFSRAGSFHGFSLLCAFAPLCLCAYLSSYRKTKTVPL